MSILKEKTTSKRSYAKITLKVRIYQRRKDKIWSKPSFKMD